MRRCGKYGILRGIMRSIATRFPALVLLSSAFVSPVGSAAAYDIKAELVFSPNSIYVVQLRNVGPAIPGPVQGKFWLTIPVGTKVVNWTLNGWQCAPSPPVQGSVTLACSMTLSAAWSPGTILSNQLFFVTFLPGVKHGPVCVRSQVLKPNPSGVYQPFGETGTSNNSLCV